MDQQIAPQLGTDLSPLRGPSVYDFRDRNDTLPAHLSDSVTVKSVHIDETPGLLGEMKRALIER